MRGGLCYVRDMPRIKPFTSFDDQINLIKGRNLALPQNVTARTFLQRHGYYRFSGYMRYFQVAPSKGDENFRNGTTWEDVVAVYEADVELRTYLMKGLQLTEIATRAAFSHAEAEIHSPYQEYLSPQAYREPPTSSFRPTDEIIRSELSRSRETFIESFKERAGNGDSWMEQVPVWAAVQVFSFGTLSKAIAYRDDGDKVYERTCSLLGVKKEFLSTQLRSFSYLRNKCAHYSRLWHLFTQDQPAVAPNIKSRAKRRVGQYDGNSVMAVIVALDDFLYKTGLDKNFLDGYLLLPLPEEFREGISHPKHA